VIVASSVALATALVWWLGRLALIPSLPERKFLTWAFALVPASGLFAAWLTQRLLGSRLSHLVEVIDGADDLARIRNLGEDEVGAIGQAVNRLLARLTSIRASMIDQERELGKAQRELQLSADLAQKTQELGQRLEERTMLFDIMRMTTSSPELDSVLSSLVERVGSLLRMREVLFFIHDEASQELVVKAARGFAPEVQVVGRSMRVGEGISGRVGKTREPLVLEDVSQEPEYQGFWGLAQKRGALAALPVTYQDQLLGVLAVTRPEQEPLTEVHLRLLSAIADTAALAIQNAQLFEHMRTLSGQDELTGLPTDALLRGQLEREIDRARRFEAPLSLLVLAVDRLAAFQDEHGREAAEGALHDIAQRVVSSVRKLDTVARSGEDRLVLLLPRTSAADARYLVEKLRKAVLSMELASVKTGQLGVNLGVAQLESSDDHLGLQLWARAEEALRASQAGYGRASASDAEPARTTPQSA
jgi:diguanylate cyclase (GGDEF)-like protein